MDRSTKCAGACQAAPATTVVSDEAGFGSDSALRTRRTNTLPIKAVRYTRGLRTSIKPYRFVYNGDS